MFIKHTWPWLGGWSISPHYVHPIKFFFFFPIAQQQQQWHMAWRRTLQHHLKKAVKNLHTGRNLRLTRKPLGPLVPDGPVAPGGPWRTKKRKMKRRREKGRSNQTKVYTDRAQSPQVVDPGGDSLTSGTHCRVCCWICQSHQLKALLWNPVPLHPRAPYLCLFWWLSGPPTSSNTESPRSRSDMVVARGNEGQGQLLIGYRCWAFEWQQGYAGPAGGCQLSSRSEKPSLQTAGYQHYILISSTSALCTQNTAAQRHLCSSAQPHCCSLFFLAQIHILRQASD